MRDKFVFEQNPALAGITTEITAALGAVIQVLRIYKEKTKGQADAAFVQLQQAMNNRPVNLGVNELKQWIRTRFITYEKEHLAVGLMTLDQMRDEIKIKAPVIYRNMIHPPAPNANVWVNKPIEPGKVCQFTFTPVDSNEFGVAVRVWNSSGGDMQTANLGSIYRGEKRFKLKVIQPRGATNQVYVKRSAEHQHYVRYQRDGVFRMIRRYVARGLNHDDAFNLESGNDLRAVTQSGNSYANEIRSTDLSGGHNVATNVVLSDRQQIISHTRGWVKRYVSTTTTLRPVYSTRGEEFRSVFGQVLIDLAFVPGDRIFDIHAHDTLHELGSSSDSVKANYHHEENPAVRSHAQEIHLAARDAIRTREVLIKSSVPNDAVRRRDETRLIVAIWHPDGPAPNHNGAAAIFQAVEQAWTAAALPAWIGFEEPEYRRNQRWYKFYLFTSEAVAMQHYDAVPKAQQDNREHWHRFDFPSVPPDGYARV